MRTTIDFDDDTAAAIARHRAETGAGLSATVNALVRRGLLAKDPAPRFTPIRRELGLRIDVRNIADALELIGGPDGR